MPVGFRGEDETVRNRQAQPVADLAEHGGFAARFAFRIGIQLGKPRGEPRFRALLQAGGIAVDFVLLRFDGRGQRPLRDAGETLQRSYDAANPLEDRSDAAAQYFRARRHVLQVVLKSGHELQRLVIQRQKLAKAGVLRAHPVRGRVGRFLLAVFATE